MKSVSTLYFEAGGSEHTRATLEAAKERALALNVEAVVVTSSSGATALEAAKVFEGTGMRIIGVGFQKHLWDRHRALEAEYADPCREMGVEFLPDEPKLELPGALSSDVVNAWRCMSQGFKVALQVAAQCVDTGLLTEGAHVISLGGSSRGADTAIALRTYGSSNVFKSKVTEVIAMPSAPKGGW